MNRLFNATFMLLLLGLGIEVRAENLNNDKQQQAIKKLDQLNVKFNSDQWLKNAASGDLRILKIMHNAGYKIGRVDSLDHSDIMHHASANGQKHVVSWALKQLTDPLIAVNKKDVNGFTPLDWAAYHGRAETIGLLLENQANPNLHPRSNNPLLTLAIQSGSLKTVKALLNFEPGLIESSFDGQNSVTTAKLTGNKMMIDLINQVMEKVQ